MGEEEKKHRMVYRLQMSIQSIHIYTRLQNLRLVIIIITYTWFCSIFNSVFSPSHSPETQDQYHLPAIANHNQQINPTYRRRIYTPTTITMARRYSTLNMLNPSHQADFYRPGSSEGSYSPSDESHSYDLLPLSSVPTPGFSPEALGAKILGPGHLSTILSNPTLLSNFADFLTHSSPSGLNTLVQYLDSQKALKALAYANAIAGGLEGGAVPADVRSKGLERCSDEAFEGLLEELAGYVTNTVVDVVSHNVTRRITGELRSDLADAVDGLGESFCLTDPRRDGNPIIFMSEGVYPPPRKPGMWC